MNDLDGPDALAERALRRLHSAPSPRPVPFTSDLTVDELVLIEQAGLEPLRLVMGTSVISALPRRVFRSGELQYATDTMYRARHRAMDQLRREAARIGAHGVVGVRIEADAERWGEHLHEFVAIGTAVRSRSGSLRSDGRPFTSHLTGQDVFALLTAGYRPLSLVMGASVCGMSRWGTIWWLAARRRRVELAWVTSQLTAARERAIQRMGREAGAARAAGVVGVSIEQRAHVWGGRATEFLALGTAVRPTGGRSTLPQLRAVVPLDVPAPRPAGISVDVAPWRRVHRRERGPR